MKIRQIAEVDISLIEPLWNELKTHHQELTTHFQQHYVDNTFDKRKSELLSKERMAIFLAETIDQKVGFCVVSTTGLVGEIDSLYVKTQARSQGIGNLLMDAGLKWLETFELDCIRLSVGEGNEEAVHYYEKLGFRERATIMQLFDRES